MFGLFASTIAEVSQIKTFGQGSLLVPSQWTNLWLGLRTIFFIYNLFSLIFFYG